MAMDPKSADFIRYYNETLSKIKATTSGFSASEKDAYIKQMNTLYDTDLKGLVATDLPISKLLKDAQLPLRRIQQISNRNKIDYDLLQMCQYNIVPGGTVQMFYQEPIKADNQSGTSDITIEYFNKQEMNALQENYTVSEEWHTEIRIPFLILNQVFQDTSQFLALFKAMEYITERPWRKERQASIIQFINNSANIDSIITLTTDDKQADAKYLFQDIMVAIGKLYTANFDTLNVKPKDIYGNEFTDNLEYKYNASNGRIRMFLDLQFSQIVNFQVFLNAFNASYAYEIQSKKDIKAIDFASIFTSGHYDTTVNNPTFTPDVIDGNLLAIIYQEGVIRQIAQYFISAMWNVGKMYSNMEAYRIYTIFKNKLKPLIMVKTAPSAPAEFQGTSYIGSNGKKVYIESGKQYKIRSLKTLGKEIDIKINNKKTKK